MKCYPHNDYYRSDEEDVVSKLLIASRLSQADRQEIFSNAKIIQAKLDDEHYLTKIIKSYDMSAPEGMALMTLCEALLRTPDKETQDLLIKDKLSNAEWNRVSNSSFYSKAAGLALTKAQLWAAYDGLVNRLGWPAIRTIIKSMVQTLGNVFVMGDTINNAIAKTDDRFSYSFDMLGEASTNWEDANLYYERYLHAARHSEMSVSVKLSAIHPRYELKNHHDVLHTMVPKLAAIARICEENNTTMFIDAEETRRLDVSILVLEELLNNYKFKDNTIGFALQAYQKRAFWVIDTLDRMAKKTQTRVFIRLVKGAYWDTEIKIAQQEGLDYPVFTRKEHTDISYFACARKLFHSKHLYTAFATHNPFTISAIKKIAKGHDKDFEFQKLYGMGDGLYNQFVNDEDIKVRVYAPVGEYKDLLAYLIRRLLENGANSSFIYNQEVTDPFVELKKQKSELKNWKNLYKNRINSKGYDLTDPAMIDYMLDSPTHPEQDEEILSVNDTIKILTEYQEQWSNTTFEHRSKLLLACADSLEEEIVGASNRLVKHAFKTYPNAVAEIRETVDFIRYYVEQAQKLYKENIKPSYTGEHNVTLYNARGPWMVIAPWNFPYAIFMGPIVAALVTGNTVLAKPAPQSFEIAKVIIASMHHIGIPEDALRICDPDVEKAEEAVKDERICGITFTGSHKSAKAIQRLIAERDGPIIPFIAETGGINCMIADSTCLPEQLVQDVTLGAFDSAGQRCSATRYLFIQKENSETILHMLKHRMKVITLGYADDLNTDVSRVIDGIAFKKVQERIAVLEEDEELIATKSRNGRDLPKLTIPPSAYLVSDYKKYFDEEIFGPLLHVYVYDKKELNEILDFINDRKFGLTLSIHSRVTSFYDNMSKKMKVGNVYVNRDQIGAVVETQPFGGYGLSGTGPKAGGPNYLMPYVWEKHVSINTTAIGGDTVLLTDDRQD